MNNLPAPKYNEIQKFLEENNLGKYRLPFSITQNLVEYNLFTSMEQKILVGLLKNHTPEEIINLVSSLHKRLQIREEQFAGGYINPNKSTTMSRYIPVAAYRERNGNNIYIQKLNLIRSGKWFDFEVSILRENISRPLAEIYKLIPSRTPSAIRKQKSKILNPKIDDYRSKNKSNTQTLI